MPHTKPKSKPKPSKITTRWVPPRGIKKPTRDSIMNMTVDEANADHCLGQLAGGMLYNLPQFDLLYLRACIDSVLTGGVILEYPSIDLDTDGDHHRETETDDTSEDITDH